MKVSAITVCVIVQNTMSVQAVDQNPESLLSALGNMSSK